MRKSALLLGILAALSILLSACEQRDLATQFAWVTGDELIDKRVAIQPGQWWQIEYTLSQDGDLYSRIDVNNSTPVSIDLLDKKDFSGFPVSYSYYESFRRQDVLDEMIIGGLAAHNEYALVVRPRFEAGTVADVTIKSYFVSNTES